ncbi:hypothetical protein HYALB_00006929 [Hymenoscyphus albidus]|uniref:Heterokaryon incompatibility domain-containing protein n=1 Tax=Hymenoscyphus albidus TaxID=595503 RepID=A0A9N9LFG7_9HELO|nr:hypothetical protein HYALB_00006929 [Hymenoscyphus albidus]
MELNHLLCSCCSHFIAKLPKVLPHERIRHHSSFQALKSSAEDGCPICARLLDGFFYDKDLDDFGTENEESFELKWKRDVFSKASITGLFYVYFNKRYLSLTSTTQIEHNYHEDCTSVIACQELASHWFQECLQNHQKCHKPSSKEPHPTRLLSVGSKGAPKLRLHVNDANSLQAEQSYATLSHCWSSKKIKKLLDDDLISMIKGISVDELPKTFQDAIELTRRLEIQFLWIDSLCIIQDSTEDWEQESARMESVYKNAVCNIAATAAENGEKGCFVKRNPALAKACRMRINTSDFEGVYELELKNDEGKDVKAFEQYPTGIPWEDQYLGLVSRFSNLPFPEEVYGVDRILQKEKSEDKADSLFRGVGLWNDLVDNYTNRSITKNQISPLLSLDWLRSPLVQKFGPEADYLAGLWSRFLPIQLVWTVGFVNDSTAEKAKGYCAPSWSWASLNWRVEYRNEFSQDRRYMIQILEAVTELVTTNPMGQVSGGYICLRGWLQRITLHRAEIVSRYHYFPFGMRLYLDTPDEFTSELIECFCLPIHSQTVYQKDVWGLLLQPTKNIKNQRMEYRRVGAFEVSEYEKDFGYFNRATYPVTSEYPTDGRNSAPVSENLSEMGTDGNLDESILAKQAADARELRERESEEERENGTNAIDRKTGWVESIITII